MIEQKDSYPDYSHTAWKAITRATAVPLAMRIVWNLHVVTDPEIFLPRPAAQLATQKDVIQVVDCPKKIPTATPARHGLNVSLIKPDDRRIQEEPRKLAKRY